MVYHALTSGPSARLAMPEMDEFQHSQISAHHSFVPPFQSRGPAKDEEEPLRIRPRAGGQRRVLAYCEQVFEDIGSGAPRTGPG